MALIQPSGSNRTAQKRGLILPGSKEAKFTAPPETQYIYQGLNNAVIRQAPPETLGQKIKSFFDPAITFFTGLEPRERTQVTRDPATGKTVVVPSVVPTTRTKVPFLPLQVETAQDKYLGQGLAKGLIEMPEKIGTSIKELPTTAKTGAVPSYGEELRVPSYAEDYVNYKEYLLSQGIEESIANSAALLGIGGQATIDVIFAGSLVSQGMKSIAKGATPALEERVAAWKMMGEPKSIKELNTTRKQLANQFHPDRMGGDASAMTEINNNTAILLKGGIPTAADIIKLKSGIAAGKITGELSKILEMPKPNYTLPYPKLPERAGFVPEQAFQANYELPQIGLGIKKTNLKPANYDYLKQDIYKPVINSADELVNSPEGVRVSAAQAVKDLINTYGISKAEADYIIKNVQGRTPEEFYKGPKPEIVPEPIIESTKEIYPKTTEIEKGIKELGQYKLRSGDSLESAYGTPEVFSDIKMTKIGDFKMNQWFSDKNTVDSYIKKIKNGEPINPIIVKNGEIIDGYHRLEALTKLGYKYVPTVFVEENLEAAKESWKKDYPGKPFIIQDYLENTPSTKYPTYQPKVQTEIAKPTEELYHVTYTDYIDSIKKTGLRSKFAPSNWLKAGNKTRYGNGEIYTFSNFEDAVRWAAEMDWAFNKKWGSGKISIVKLKKNGKWAIDTNDPLSQLGRKGDWLKSKDNVKPEDITAEVVFTEDIVKMLKTKGFEESDFSKVKWNEIAKPSETTLGGESKNIQTVYHVTTPDRAKLLNETGIPNKYPFYAWKTREDAELYAKTLPKGKDYEIVEVKGIPLNKKGATKPIRYTQILAEKDVVPKVKTPVIQQPITPKRPPSLRQLGIVPKRKMITRPEDLLLKDRLRAESRGARAGIKAGYEEAKGELTKIFKERRLTERESRNMVIDFVKAYLPPEYRGRALSMVASAKTYKDVTKAFFRITEMAKGIKLNQAIADLKEKIDKLSKSHVIDVEYTKRIKDLVKNIDLDKHRPQTMKELQATKDYLEKERALGNDVTVPARIIEKLQILAKVPRKDLTISQIEGLLSEVDFLEEMGRLKLKTREAIYELEKDKLKQELLKTAVNVSPRELAKAPVGERLGKLVEAVNSYKRLLNAIQSKLDLPLTPMEGLAKITGMQGIMDKIILDWGNYLTHELKNEIYDERLAIIKKYGLDDKNMERAGVYAATKQPGGYEKLANKGISKEEADKIVLTEGEKVYYDFVRKINEKIYPEVKNYMKEVYNKEVAKVENYVSFYSDADEFSDLEMFDRFGGQADFVMRTKKVPEGFTKKRTGAGTQKIEINLDKIFLRHTDDVAYMLSMGKDAKMITEILNDAKMGETMGDVSSYMWKEYIDLLARKGGAANAKRIAMVDGLRRTMGAGTMPWKLGSALVQFSSLADGASRITGRYMFQGAMDIGTSKEWRKFIWDNFPEIRKTIADDPSYLDLGSNWMGDMARKGFAPLKAFDGLVRTSTAAGAYRKIMNEAGKTIDFAHPDKEVINQVQEIVRKTQGTSFFVYQPLAVSKGLMTGNVSVDKAFLQFQNFMLNKWENIKDLAWREGIKKKHWKDASFALFWTLIVASAFEQGLRKLGKKAINFITGNEEEDDETFWGELAKNTIQTVPLFGSLAGSIMYDTNPVPIINTLENVITGFGNLATGKTEETKLKGAITGMGGLAQVLGVGGAAQLTEILKKSVGGGTKTSTPSGLPRLPKTPALPKSPRLPKIPKI